MNAGDDFDRSNAGLGAAWEQSPGLPKGPKDPQPGDWIMIEIFCRCRAPVGEVGVPNKRGASIIQVEFKCAECGHTTWWRCVR